MVVAEEEEDTTILQQQHHLITENGVQQLMDQMISHGLLTLMDGEVKDGGNHHVVDDDDDDNKDSFEEFRRWTKKHQQQQMQQKEDHHIDQKAVTTTDANCRRSCRLIASISKDCYYTVPHGIRKAVLGEISKTSGRMTVSGIAQQLHLTETSLETAASSFCSSDNQCGDEDIMHLTIGAQTELFTPQYWEAVSADIRRRLEETEKEVDASEQGRYLNILDLSKEFNLPVEIFQTNVLSKLNSSSSISGPATQSITVLDDSMIIVNKSFVAKIKHQAQTFFSDLTKPINVSTACQQHKDDHWDLKLLVSWMNDENSDDEFRKACNGEFHYDNGAGIFIPNIYQQKQKKSILDYISVNGYITSERANQITQGVTVSDMIKIVQKEYGESATIIKDDAESSNTKTVMIVLDHFLQGIQVSIKEYLDTNTPSSFSSMATEALDLQQYISPELMESPDLVMKLLSEAGLAESVLMQNRGIAVVVEDQAIIVRSDFIEHINSAMMPKLIEAYALTKAEEMFARPSEGIIGNEDDDEFHDGDRHGGSGKTSKSRSKGKRGKTKKHKSHGGGAKTTANVGVVPLHQVAETFLHEFPSFFPEQFIETYDASKLNNVEWEAEASKNDHAKRYDESSDLVVSFCRRALYTDKFVSQCEQAVTAELRRLESEKQSKATLSRKDAAAKVRNVEEAFEEAFTNLCLLIQAQVKFIKYFETISIPGEEGTDQDNAVEILTDELLCGLCADLTGRITQHALFKEEEEFDFTFVPPESTDSQKKTSGDETSSLPMFCDEVDITQRCYPKTYLSCPPPRDPLPLLRESFSGNNIGVTLARQWVYCGGHCYRGGVIIRSSSHDDSGSGENSGQKDEQIHHVRPGNLDDFLSHVETNALTLCGLPFKKLDKKAEKSLLYARKQKLTTLLSQTTSNNAKDDAVGEVLDLTIMILYQQVKQLVVYGSLLRTSILHALVNERKIPNVVGLGLQRLDKDIQNKTSIDENLVLLIKDCALSRDVSKHDITELERYFE